MSKSKSGGVFSIFRRADDVTRTMSKGGGVLVNVFTPPPFRKSCIRAWIWIGTPPKALPYFAHCLRRTVLDTEVSPLVRDVITQNFYVDDLLCSVKTKREATEILQCVKEVLGYGGFHLTKYIVNDTHLLEQIPESDRAKEVKEIAQESWCKALGIRWDFMTDEFCLCQ